MMQSQSDPFMTAALQALNPHLYQPQSTPYEHASGIANTLALEGDTAQRDIHRNPIDPLQATPSFGETQLCFPQLPLRVPYGSIDPALPPVVTNQTQISSVPTATRLSHWHRARDNFQLMVPNHGVGLRAPGYFNPKPLEYQSGDLVDISSLSPFNIVEDSGGIQTIGIQTIKQEPPSSPETSPVYEWSSTNEKKGEGTTPLAQQPPVAGSSRPRSKKSRKLNILRIKETKSISPKVATSPSVVEGEPTRREGQALDYTAEELDNLADTIVRVAPQGTIGWHVVASTHEQWCVTQNRTVRLAGEIEARFGKLWEHRHPAENVQLPPQMCLPFRNVEHPDLGLRASNGIHALNQPSFASMIPAQSMRPPPILPTTQSSVAQWPFSKAKRRRQRKRRHKKQNGGFHSNNQANNQQNPLQTIPGLQQHGFGMTGGLTRTNGAPEGNTLLDLGTGLPLRNDDSSCNGFGAWGATFRPYSGTSSGSGSSIHPGIVGMERQPAMHHNIGSFQRPFHIQLPTALNGRR